MKADSTMMNTGGNAMGHKRKTIQVEEFKTYMNSKLALEDNEHVNPLVRKAWAFILEHYLMETGNYKGYGYKNLDTLAKDETKRIYY
jgi:hypothetical protein